MLGQIANFCTVISRNSIVNNSTSLIDIWQKIHQHFGFEATGAHFLDISTSSFNPDECPEDLYQRLLALFDDNLLTPGAGLRHHGEAWPKWWGFESHHREHYCFFVASSGPPWTTTTCYTEIWSRTSSPNTSISKTTDFISSQLCQRGDQKHRGLQSVLYSSTVIQTLLRS